MEPRSIHGVMESLMAQTSGLTVRQHEREGIEVPVEFYVCPEHGSQVHFSSGSAAQGQHVIRGKAIDISSGGMGLEFRQFLPRMCEGTVRVFAPNPMLDGDGAALYEPVFEHRVKVRRVYLVGREPLYSMGVAFVNHGPDIDERITKLLLRIKSLQPKPRSGGRGGANA